MENAMGGGVFWRVLCGEQKVGTGGVACSRILPSKHFTGKVGVASRCTGAALCPLCQGQWSQAAGLSSQGPLACRKDSSAASAVRAAWMSREGQSEAGRPNGEGRGGACCTCPAGSSSQAVLCGAWPCHASASLTAVGVSQGTGSRPCSASSLSLGRQGPGRWPGGGTPTLKETA